MIIRQHLAMPRALSLLWISSLLASTFASPSFGDRDFPQRTRLATSGGRQQVAEDVPLQRPFQVENTRSDDPHESSPYPTLVNALEVMESQFFDVSQGTWPEAIDWTAAVMGTQVSATLTAMTEYKSHCSADLHPPSLAEARDHENQINRYFSQITSYYFGENAFALRTQAYDDMFWVVLGWLEAIKFINRHSQLHYTSLDTSTEQSHRSNHSWYARQFIPQYAHRARLFYDLASRGWDTTLCGGGMVWNPHLAPYKNSITNELYIAASVGMYLHFPGDSNSSPFVQEATSKSDETLPPTKAHDFKYLNNAVEAYTWLKGSGMRNEQGLYVDGFHVQGWRGGKDGSNGTRKCDLREEKVYTYNQGVLLSGLRGLWDATRSIEYLQDGHELLRNVIAATGWEDRDTERKWRWAGLGRNGVLEELCDWSGSCTQNGQTFKGIFFHHLTLFCAPIPESCEGLENCPTAQDNNGRHLHQQSCDGYGDWIRHNAFAALVTRDEDGVFGEWWGRPSPQRHDDRPLPFDTPTEVQPPPSEGTDYRNLGVPKDEIWRLPEDDVMYKSDMYSAREQFGKGGDVGMHSEDGVMKRDINDRGRGRTVETQSGGLAVLRALWKLVDGRGRGRGGCLL